MYLDSPTSETAVKVFQVTGRRDMRDFIYLPEKIHKDHEGWVPPVYYQEWHYYDPRKNRAMTYSDTVLALASMNGKIVGRIMGLINKRCNEFRNQKDARFGCLECPNDYSVAHALLSYVEKWATEKGMKKIVGPMGFNNQDPSGFLIDGFDQNPTFSTYHNYEYINHLLERDNYSKDVDYVVYKVDIMEEAPEFYSKVYDRIKRRKEYKINEFTRRKQLKPFIEPILQLMNECFTDLYGFQPLDNIEMKKLAKRYSLFLDPRFVKIVTKDNRVVGFNIAMPNLSEGFRKAKGRLLPFGIIHILRASKKTEQLDSLIGAIAEEYRGRGLDAAMAYTTIMSARKAGMKFADSHHELEDNIKVRAEMERLGGKVYKRFRIYKKDLQT